MVENMSKILIYKLNLASKISQFSNKIKVIFGVQIQNLFLNTVIAMSIHFFYIFPSKTQDAYLVQKLFGIFCLQVDPDGKTDFVLAKSSEFSRQLFNSGTSSCSAFSSIKLAVDNLPKFTNCSGLHDGLTQ